MIKRISLASILFFSTAFILAGCYNKGLVRQKGEPNLVSKSLDVSSAKLCGPHMGIVDEGYPWGRADADFDGDGCLDYCRVVGNTNHVDAAIWCTISYGPLAGRTIQSQGSFDWGYPEGRAWIDVNRDGKADYCRVVGNNNGGDSRIACNLSIGDQFGPKLLSNVIDWGYPDLRSFEDCDGNGSIDYCRRVGNTGATFIGCSSINVGQADLAIPQEFSCRKDDPNREKRGLCGCQWIVYSNGERRGMGLIGEKVRICGQTACHNYCTNLAIRERKNLEPVYEGSVDCP